jgi:hypothetical protein
MRFIPPSKCFLVIKLVYFNVWILILIPVIRVLVIACILSDRLCGLVARVLGYRFGGPGSIPGTTRKKK